MVHIHGPEQKQWYLISALTKTMVHNHGYYGTKSGLVWYLFSGPLFLMVFNLLWILIRRPIVNANRVSHIEVAFLNLL